MGRTGATKALLLLLLRLVAGLPGAGAPARSLVAQQPATESAARAELAAAPVTPAQFARLRWLEGTWRGRLPNGAHFYERYAVVDDSTIQMTTYADSTLAQPKPGDRIVLRGGVVRYENVVATRLDDTRVEFAAPGGRFGFTWVRDGARHWTATIRQTGPTGEVRTVAYPMAAYTAPGRPTARPRQR